MAIITINSLLMINGDNLPFLATISHYTLLMALFTMNWPVLNISLIVTIWPLLTASLLVVADVF